MQTLYLIRHTTPDIAPGLCYGQLDIDVSDSFEEEAANVLHWLPPLDIIISSPLLRTRRLAKFLATTANCKLERSGRNVSSGHRTAYPLRVQTDLRLMEKHFGAWEGRAWDDIERTEIDAWAADVMGYAPPCGESAQQLMQRVQALLRDLAQLPRQNIALVAHGGTIRAILAQLACVPLTNTLNWKIDYGAVIGVKPA
ncbi:MAG: alpha-ribazole phosphatase family protein [Gallionella sp.]|nr:alpha-ribazole phosphatase family protein [Gallionella sp.]